MLYGAAGTGKSTVSQIMAYKWGKQELWDHLDFVFHLECRKLNTDITNDKQYTLEELLFKLQCPDVARNNNVSQEFSQYITKQLNKVMIIIDGLDELAKWNETVENRQKNRIVITGNRQKAVIPNLLYSLITGEFIENIIVLVTSRPIQEIRASWFNKIIMALGFDEDAIDSCSFAVCENNREIHQKIDGVHTSQKSAVQSLCGPSQLYTTYSHVIQGAEKGVWRTDPGYHLEQSQSALCQGWFFTSYTRIETSGTCSLV